MDLLSECIGRLRRMIAFPSVSNVSNSDITDWIQHDLVQLGFDVERTSYVDGKGQTKCNLIARRGPSSESGGLAYFAHSDVVPAADWTGPGGDPFVPMQHDDRIYGRGACDMKGSLATMLSAASSFDARAQHAPLWIVVTADEEVGFDGANHIVQHSAAYRELVSAQPVSIIGEPTSLGVVHAHKGIAGAKITSRGRAAHSSTRLGANANEAIVPILNTLLELCHKTRQQSEYLHERFDPPDLSWNFGVSDHATAVNITPALSTAWVCFRSMPGIDGRDLLQTLRDQCDELGLSLSEMPGSGPLWTDPEAPCVQAFCELAGGEPKTVCYGTDGGVLTELTRRIVCGPGDIAQAHTSDEWISLDQLQRGIELYSKAITRWCVKPS
ncbi:M20 family metallopeptidase [Stieleria varia]|uniref:Acetylornithine deacetylase n=1 Tax=Stieleria varia TaxID=2528005 RepID=A0A5C6B759_9BACT|nr:M20 family metallopeptidase [Stieleria varia]TWU07873.1 Acetylornithine deacetylase [Stieleria varia]